MITQITRRNGPTSGTLRVVGVLFGVATAFALTTQTARAFLLAYEGFDYAAGSSFLGGIGGFGFANAWQTNNANSAGTSSIAVSGSLGYTDSTGHVLYTSGNSALFSGSTTANNSATPNRNFVFQRGTNSTDSTTWMSMLVWRQGQATTNANPYGRGAAVTFYNTGAERFGVGMNSNVPTNAVGLTIQGNSSLIRQTTVPFNQLDFVIVRIDHIAGTNDNAYIWVNPTDISAAPDVSTALRNSIGTYDFTFNRIQMFVGGNASASQPTAILAVDEIRLGTDFADIAPWIPVTVPEPSVIALGALSGLALLVLRRRKQ
jgi:hypothetical protein